MNKKNKELPLNNRIGKIQDISNENNEQNIKCLKRTLHNFFMII